MNPQLVGVIGLIVLIVLFFSRIPVAYVMALVGFVGFSVLRGMEPGLNLLARDLYSVFSSHGLTIIPLFVLMGQFAFHGGIAKRIYSAAYHWTGFMPGGLAMATVGACTAFGAVCGSGPATAATMATVGLPEMKRYGYDSELACGVVASGGGLGMLMPPSVVLIVYGVLTQESIGKLFVAGVLPALQIMLLFMLTVSLVCWLRPELGPAGNRFTLKQKMVALIDLADTLLIFLFVIGGLFVGWFAPTEAGAMGAIGVMLAAMARGKLGWRKIVRSLEDTLRTSAMVLMLVAGAVIFGHFLAVTGIPYAIANLIAEVQMPGWVVMTLIVLVYLLGGCVIDALALIMLTIPIFFPIVENLGYDPVWFGVIIVLVTQMGVITPPVGINAYIVQGVDTKTPLEKIFKGVMPFLLALIVGTMLMIFWPGLITWLPNQMYS
jgi:C4-dicarboxylate transporter DctM subunit